MTRTMSISLQESLYERMRQSIPSKKISKFVSEAILHELELKEKELILAYKEAEQNKTRQKFLQEWDEINDSIEK